MATLPPSNGNGHRRDTLTGVADGHDVAPTNAPTTSGGVAVYMRVSSEDQKRQGTIENQRTAIDRYLKAYDLTPYGSYEDEAVSGHFVPFGQRPEGKRLLADAKAGHIKTVIVWKLDRFGRNAREMLNAVHELQQVGALLHSLQEGFDTSKAAGRLMLTMLAAIAEYEWEGIMERTEAGMERRLEATTWMGGRAPIGYRVEGRRSAARLVLADQVDPQSGYSEVDVVKNLCWHLLVEQDWPTDRIADRLTELGIPTREGTKKAALVDVAPAEAEGEADEEEEDNEEDGARGRWAPGVVYRILVDPVYTGERTYKAKDGTVHTQQVPAILTTEQWERAQAKLREHKRYSHKSPNHDYLLRGLMRCDLCGAPYTTSWARLNGGKGDLWRYYACATRHYRKQYWRRTRTAAPDCVAPSVDAAAIEKDVWEQIEAYIREPGAVLTLLAAQLGTQAGASEEQRAELARVDRELKAKQRERHAVYTFHRELAADGLMNAEDLRCQLDDIAGRERDLQAQRALVQAALQRAGEAQERVEHARRLLQQLHARLDSEAMTPALQREIVQALVLEAWVETVEVGLSTRGRMKREARVRVRYAFEDPKTRAAGTATATDLPTAGAPDHEPGANDGTMTSGQAGSASAHSLSVPSSVWR
jgi:site-specific DNA recombinase